MRLIDVDNLIDDCKRYLATLNPDRDGKECTRIRWLIGILNNAPSIDPDTPTDCISRQVAVEAVHKNYDKILDFKSDGKTIASSVEDIICDLPSAQPERKPGHWEIYIISMFDGEGCRCSECGFEGAPYWDFCPNCGADMREKQNEQND